MTALVYIEELGDVTEQTLTFARGLGEPVHGFCTGDAVEVSGVESVHLAGGDAFASFAPAAAARALVELAGRLSPSAIVASGTPRGNEVLARVAAIMDLPFAANCIAADGDAVTRVRWGGSLLEEAQLHGSPR